MKKGRRGVKKEKEVEKKENNGKTKREESVASEDSAETAADTSSDSGSDSVSDSASERSEALLSAARESKPLGIQDHERDGAVLSALEAGEGACAVRELSDDEEAPAGRCTKLSKLSTKKLFTFCFIGFVLLIGSIVLPFFPRNARSMMKEVTFVWVVG